MGVEARTESGEPTPRRQYRSRLRDQQTADTRAALIASAGELFGSKGWAATGMREVAAAAGVATETVYAHFSSKRGLLRALVDVAVVGDDRPVALAERPEFAAIGRGDRADRTRAAAHVLAAVHERTAPWAKLLREAAYHDDEIAEMLRATRERQRLDIAAGVELITGRPSTPIERDAVWAIASPEVYLLLVEESGWTLDQYEEWAAEAFDRFVPRA
jgi:AcrR family transcriptional regulator